MAGQSNDSLLELLRLIVAQVDGTQLGHFDWHFGDFEFYLYFVLLLPKSYRRSASMDLCGLRCVCVCVPDDGRD